MSGPADDHRVGCGTCALCHRVVRVLTRHHLIPRCRHDRSRRRTEPERAVAELATVDLCRPCHHHLHLAISERELARSWATLPALAAHPQVAAFTTWIARRPDGATIPFATKKRR